MLQYTKTQGYHLREFKVLEKTNNLASFSSKNTKNPIYFVFFNSCIYYQVNQSNHINLNDFLLSKGYQDKLLDIKEKYYLLHNIESLTQSIHCFFLPQSLLPKKTKTALLDIFLPLHFNQPQFCAIFIAQNECMFCFYQNQELLFCKKLNHPQEELHSCLKLLKSCFGFQDSVIYALNYQASQLTLQSLKSQFLLKPLFALIDSHHQNFSISTNTPHFPLPSFKNFIPTPTKRHSASIKTFLQLTLLSLALPFLALFALWIYQDYLQSKVNSLQQNSQEISIHTIKELKEANSSLALTLYPYIQPQHIKALESILPLFHNIISFSFQSPKTFILTINAPTPPPTLLAKLNSYGYKTTISQEKEKLIFSIEVDDD